MINLWKHWFIFFRKKLCLFKNNNDGKIFDVAKLYFKNKIYTLIYRILSHQMVCDKVAYNHTFLPTYARSYLFVCTLDDWTYSIFLYSSSSQLSLVCLVVFISESLYKEKNVNQLYIIYLKSIFVSWTIATYRYWHSTIVMLTINNINVI